PTSPVIAHDDTSGTDSDRDFTIYVPTTRPGARLPHTWLADGRSLYDTLGTGMTLITFEDTDSAMAEAARRRGVPLTVVDLRGVALGQDDPTSALLVRPDQHIAWRGRESSTDSVDVLLDRILDRSTTSSPR